MVERDKEIDRLNRALQGGRPHDVISLEAQNISNEKLIGHLNLQVSVTPRTRVLRPVARLRHCAVVASLLLSPALPSGFSFDNSHQYESCHGAAHCLSG